MKKKYFLFFSFFYLLLFVSLNCLSSVWAKNEKILDFNQSKKELKKGLIWPFEGERAKTFYCECQYNLANKKILYSRDNKNKNDSCSYEENSRKNADKKRAERLEWEHLVPASLLGKSSLLKGLKGGRKKLQKLSPLFNLMEADLYNLFPAIGEINKKRSNYDFSETPSTQEYDFQGTESLCKGRLVLYSPLPSKKNQLSPLVVPDASLRGEIARAYLYAHKIYEIPLTQEQALMFERWRKEFPPDQESCQRAKKIQEIQGNSHPFYLEDCEKILPISK